MNKPHSLGFFVLLLLSGNSSPSQRTLAFTLPPRGRATLCASSPDSHLASSPEDYFSGNYDGRWERPFRYEYNSCYLEDFDDFPPRQRPPRVGAYPKSYSRKYQDFEYQRDDDNQRRDAGRDGGDEYFSQGGTTFPGERRRDEYSYPPLKSTFQNRKNSRLPLYDSPLPRRRPSFSAAADYPRSHAMMDAVFELWDDNARRRSTSLLTSPLPPSSFFGSLWGSSPSVSNASFGDIRSMMMSTMMTMMNDQINDDRVLEIILEQTEESLNSHATCSEVLGPDIRISRVLSYSQQSSEFWCSRDDDYSYYGQGRPDYQQRQLIELQVRVLGSSTEAIAFLLATNGGKLEQIILQLNTGQEINVPVAIMGGDDGWRSSGPMPWSAPAPSSIERTRQQERMRRRNDRSMMENDSDVVVDAEIVEEHNEEKNEDADNFDDYDIGFTPRRSWRRRQPAIWHRQYP